MIRRASCTRAVLCLLIAALPSWGGVIAEFTSALTAASPVQAGRLFRDGIPSDWSSPKAFPGIVNPTTTFPFETFTVNVDSTPFIQIDFDEIGGTANLFASAYLNSYNPTSLATNYLGDAGQSGDFFGVNPLVFQVIVPSNQNLVVLVNAVNGAAIGTPFKITVEGFIDSNFNSVPEPGSWMLAAAGLALMIACTSRRGIALSKRFY